jgi:hypothetical protein
MLFGTALVWLGGWLCSEPVGYWVYTRETRSEQAFNDEVTQECKFAL